MLRLSNFVTCRKRYYNRSMGVYISALEHCRKIKLITYLLLLMLSWLSDFVVCSKSLYILSSGSISKV